jgi:hypothetical protein
MRISNLFGAICLVGMLVLSGCCTKSGGESKNQSPRPWGGGPNKGSLPGNMNEGR